MTIDAAGVTAAVLRRAGAPGGGLRRSHDLAPGHVVAAKSSVGGSKSAGPSRRIRATRRSPPSRMIDV
ncbi:MAG: hypothetical protein L0I76_37130 [Pseudonocardia sp.]|nr:hypothetical protein [Pseudonocardia sp.]